MTAYEAIDLFREFLTDTYQMVFSYAGLIYAFLVISYLVAHKLKRVLVVIVLSLYLGISVFLILSIGSYRAEASDLYIMIHQLKASGVYTNIDWFGEGSVEFFKLGYYLQQVVLVGAFIGSIIFFFYRRTHAHIKDDPLI